MNTKEFGKFLTELRKEKGYTQIQLAEMLNVTDKAISRWETGKNYPDIEMFQNLSNVLGISISELLEGKRIAKEQLFKKSEEQVVKQIKKNKKMAKKFVIIIIVIATILSTLLGRVILNETGVLSDKIYHKLDCYSNDALTALNHIDGFIAQRPKSEGEFIVERGSIMIYPNKTLNAHSFLDGTCENGRSFQVSLWEDSNYYSIIEDRKNQVAVEGLYLKDLKNIVSQLDLSIFSGFNSYDLDIWEIDEYINQNIKPIFEYRKDEKQFIYSNGVLRQAKEKTINGRYVAISLSGEDAGNYKYLATIYCEIEKYKAS